MRSLAPRLLALVLLLGGCESGERSFEAPLVLGGVEVSADVLNHGEMVYMQRCRRCHGQHGTGNGSWASSMDPRPADLTTGRYPRLGVVEGELPSDAQLRAAIVDGIDGTNMGPQLLDGAPLEAVIAYVKTLSPAWRTARPAAP